MNVEAETLLVHAGFVRAIARRLLRDPELAEDVVQDTWVTALRRPPRQSGNVRGWLGTVARHLALRRRQREAQRPDRERRAARPEANTAQGIDEVELTRRIAGAVLALDEPYKTVILQRFYRDWTPSRIARETGTPVNTVKTRLRRALATLREQLDQKADGRRCLWVPALASLAGATAGAAFLTAKKLLLAAVVLAAAGVGTVAWQRSSTERNAPVNRQARHVPAPPKTKTEASPPSKTAPQKKNTVPVPPATPFAYEGKVVDENGRGIAGARVEMLYVGKQMGTGGGMELLVLAGREKRLGRSFTTSGSDGTFLFGRQSVQWAAVFRASREGYAPGATASPARPCTIVLHRRLPVRVVVTAQGQPVAGARVALTPSAERLPLRQILFETTTDAEGIVGLPLIDGRLQLEVDPIEATLGSVHRPVTLTAGVLPIELPPQSTRRVRLVDASTGAPLPLGFVAFVRTAGTGYAGRESPVRKVPAEADGYVDLPWHKDWSAFASAPGYEWIFVMSDTVRLRRAMTVTGRVLDPQGRQMTNVPLFVSLESNPTGRGSAGLPVITVWTDSVGRFEVTIRQYRPRTLPYPPDIGRRTLVAFDRRYGLAFSKSIAVRPSVRVETTLRFGRNGTLRLHLLDRDGQPIVGATPTIARVDRTPETWKGRREHGLDVRRVVGRARAKTDSRGRVVVADLSAGRYRITHERVSREVDVEAGETRDVEIRIGAGPGITGQVFGRDGAPLADLQIYVSGKSYGGTRTDARGRFTFPDMKAGPHTVALMRVDGVRFTVPAKRGDELVIREPSGRTRARIELTGVDAALVEHSVMTLSETVPAYGKVAPLQDGLTLPFLPGRAILFVRAKGHGWRAVDFVAKDGDVFVVRVDLPPAGGVAGIVTGLPAGINWFAQVEPYDGPHRELVRSRSPYTRGIIHVFHGWDWWKGIKNGRFEIGNLMPGRWKLRIGHQPDGPGFVDVATKDFVVRSGETTTVEVAIDPGYAPGR